MPHASTLSSTAHELLRLHFSRRSLIVGGVNSESLPGRTLEETKAAYRELADAGLMLPMHSFVGGPDSVYRLTDEANPWQEELSAPVPSPLPRSA